MLSFTNLALRRGPNLLFEDVSFVIHRDKKVGLIGANGAGKTSLFKMITGDLDVEEGYLDHPMIYVFLIWPRKLQALMRWLCNMCLRAISS